MAKKIKVKPGKQNSKFTMIVLIGFCIIGIVVVIPIFGPFGILWTCVAAFGVYSNYKNAYTEEGIPSYEIEIEEGSDSIEGRLKKLESLYNQGLITRDEYDEKRKQILNEI